MREHIFVGGPTLRRRRSRICGAGSPSRARARVIAFAAVAVVAFVASSRVGPQAAFFVPAPRVPNVALTPSGVDGHARVAPRAMKISADASTVPERSSLVQAWGALGCAAYLAYGMKKVVPVVREGIAMIKTREQWALLVATLVFFAYVEGYRGFQKGFSPRVVSRAWAVSERSEDAPMWHKLLAPMFCIGYFHGTRARIIASWAVTAAVFLVVVGVRRLANPYRAIIDAGVIVGLLWGSASVLILFARSLLEGRPPDFDPCLPTGSPYFGNAVEEY